MQRLVKHNDSRGRIGAVKTRLCLAFAACLLAGSAGAHVGEAQPSGLTSIFADRLARAYARLGNNLLIIRSNASPAPLTAAGFDQDPAFFYFTGAARLLGGILVLDGGTRRTELFVPADLPNDWRLFAPTQAQSSLSSSVLHVGRVSRWQAFAQYVDGRLTGVSPPTIYVDAGGSAGILGGSLSASVDSLASLANAARAWRHLIQQRWPKADVRSDAGIVETLRAVKDSSEIAILRRVARASADAFLAGLPRFSPGRHQRDVEAAVVEACVRLGPGGISFWPWAMSGPNSAFPAPFTSLVDPQHLDRVMRTGEIVRFDIGCEIDHYMGDVGRTVPVSGTYSADQREVVDLLVAAYRSGIATILDGATIEAVVQASVDEVKRRTTALHTKLGREAAAVITRSGGIPFWQMHGIGLDAAEQLPDTLRAGMVLDYEPIFVVGGEGYYMEDMILVTNTKAEILTTGLPTTAAEIERVMRPRRR
jgi:Xaa-Pro aminopeptidase